MELRSLLFACLLHLFVSYLFVLCSQGPRIKVLEMIQLYREHHISDLLFKEDMQVRYFILQRNT